jgi:hypothetical protein
VNEPAVRKLFCLIAVFAGASLGCGSDEEAPSARWEPVFTELPGALLSVWGTGPSDVWAAGAVAAPGGGPTVLHFDGNTWSQPEVEASANLWWVYGFAGGPVYFAGEGGTILRRDTSGEFVRMTTPGQGAVFGIWGVSPDDLWAVGGEPGGANGAFAWRLVGDEWVAAPGVPAELTARAALWKVYGRSSSDVWLVGTDGNVLHWDGDTLSASTTGLMESLFTVHANSERFVAVGGFGTGLILEREAGADSWSNASPQGAPSLIGVCVTESTGYAVGEFGAVYVRDANGWREDADGAELGLDLESLHSVWIDSEGGVWAVGGKIRTPPFVGGVMLHKGQTVPAGVGL